MQSQYRAGVSKNSAVKSRFSSNPRRFGDNSKISHHGKSPKNVPLMKNKNTAQRFMTKKEREAKDREEKRNKALERNKKRMKELALEIEEMTNLVHNQVKHPEVQRRHSIQDYSQMPLIQQAYAKMQKKDVEEEKKNNDEIQMDSMFGEDVDFYEHRTKKKEDFFGRLEWRTQFKPLDEIVTSKRENRWAEKTKRRDKSSDAHFVHDELIRTIHSRATEEELSVLTKLTFLEKYIGFTNQDKRRMMLDKGREKIDESYIWLRNTMIQSKQLYQELDKKKQKIVALQKEAEDYDEKINNAKNEHTRQDGLVEDARSLLKQTDSKRTIDLEDKECEISEAKIKLELQQAEMKRLYEISQMMFEDERSHCLKLVSEKEYEIQKSKRDIQSKNQSQELTLLEQQMDRQLSMSKPLVTEIMEFFYNKERESNNEQSLEELVSELQDALEMTLQSGHTFEEAAYHDPSSNLSLQRQQRNQYAERTRFGL